MAKENKQYWSMIEEVFNCLVDEEKTNTFNKAIKINLKNNGGK